MNKPTKKQLIDRLTHLETNLNDLIEGRTGYNTVEEYYDFLVRVVSQAPSLEPAVKVVVTEQSDAVDASEASEAPAVH